MLKRRRVLLHFLYQLGEAIEPHVFQHLLFLLSQRQREPHYYFVPLPSGPVSVEAEADKRALTRNGVLSESDAWMLSEDPGVLPAISKEDQQFINETVEGYKGRSDVEIFREVYLRYPYFGINSAYATRFLTDVEYEAIANARPKRVGGAFFTVGYEGRHIEQFLNLLIEYDVRLLADVRKNALSMKLGYSKKTLRDLTSLIGVEYLHFTELGIPSEQRRDLDSVEKRVQLFDHYEREMLPMQGEALSRLHQLYEEKKRIAILCYEKESVMCHRYRISRAMQEMGVQKIVDL